MNDLNNCRQCRSSSNGKAVSVHESSQPKSVFGSEELMCSCEEWVFWILTVHVTAQHTVLSLSPVGEKAFGKAEGLGTCEVTSFPLHMLSFLGNLGSSCLLPSVTPQPSTVFLPVLLFPNLDPHLLEATQVSCCALWFSTVGRSSKHVYGGAINLWCSFHWKLKAFPIMENYISGEALGLPCLLQNGQADGVQVNSLAGLSSSNIPLLSCSGGEGRDWKSNPGPHGTYLSLNSFLFRPAVFRGL